MSLLLTGVNTVTSLVESKKAQLVIIAHDVDPIEVSLFWFLRSSGAVLCTTKQSLAMMSEFLHLNPLCGSKHTSFLTLSRDHTPKTQALTMFIVDTTVLVILFSSLGLLDLKSLSPVFPCSSSSSSSSCQLCAARWASHTASSRAKLDWADWCTGRHALQSPSHRQTRKFAHNCSS